MAPHVRPSVAILWTPEPTSMPPSPLTHTLSHTHTLSLSLVLSFLSLHSLTLKHRRKKGGGGACWPTPSGVHHGGGVEVAVLKGSWGIEEGGVLSSSPQGARKEKDYPIRKDPSHQGPHPSSPSHGEAFHHLVSALGKLRIAKCHIFFQFMNAHLENDSNGLDVVCTQCTFI